MPRVAMTVLYTGLLLLLAAGTSAQTYPNRPIQVFTGEAGSAADFFMRAVAPGISESLGQPVIVNNRGGTLAIQTVAKLPPDGYALVVFGSVMWLSQYMRDNLPWDPMRDFVCITIGLVQPNFLVVHPSLPVRSVKDLIALAKTHPGEIYYGTSGAGGASHLAAELFRSMARVDMVRVPYKGTPTAIIDLLGGRIQMMFSPSGTVAVHLNSGRLRALAVSSSTPSVLAPGLPTIAATLPGYEAVSLAGWFAPAKTPVAVIELLNQEFARVLQSEQVKAKLLSAGMEPGGDSSTHSTQVIKAEMERMGKLIKDVGIRDN